MNWKVVRWWLIYAALSAAGTLVLGFHARWWWYAILYFCAMQITNQVAGRR